MHAFLVIDKPQGISSHSVVSRLRRILNIKRIGHTGTLDPMATGVLPVAVGEATRVIPFLAEELKSYRATIRLGAATDTQDAEGEVIFKGSTDSLDEQKVRTAIQPLCGVSEQLPPMYSAIKQNGVPLYKLARRGEDVERKRRTINVYDWSLDHYSQNELICTINCSRGTYVRTLAHDLGHVLGCGAHLTALRRLQSGPFTINQALTLENLEHLSVEEIQQNSITMLDALSHRLPLEVCESAMGRLLDGVPPTVDMVKGVFPEPEVPVVLVFRQCLVATAIFDPNHTLDNRGDFKLERVFNQVREVFE